ncbi:MAG: hypothetical protein NTZ05_12840 [Chloroflexi bacterium]|nr:hypothetical protein [Chloroflexota bacterium]
MRSKRGCRRAAGAAILVFALLLLVPPLYVATGCSGGPPTPPAGNGTAVQPAMPLATVARNEAWTYLTLPEWYIVYSAEEYASVLEHGRPSQFPYFGAIGQFWDYYHMVYCATKDPYPFDGGYHLMIYVIGTSFTAENALKGAYEMTTGRVTEWLSFGQPVDEDRFAAATAREYATFMHTVPWYEFPFAQHFTALWGQTGVFGPHLLRKWERKAFLSAEYGVKTGYGAAIAKATGGVYAPEDLEIQAALSHVPPTLFTDDPRIKLLGQPAPDISLVTIPRYAAFTEIVTGLARQSVTFLEIAGNSTILVTAIAPQDWRNQSASVRLLSAMPILTEPGRRRIALAVPVTMLHTVLPALEQEGVRIEHIYDY